MLLANFSNKEGINQRGTERNGQEWNGIMYAVEYLHHRRPLHRHNSRLKVRLRSGDQKNSFCGP
jgi:hypothetical protein